MLNAILRGVLTENGWALNTNISAEGAALVAGFGAAVFPTLKP